MGNKGSRNKHKDQKISVNDRFAKTQITPPQEQQYQVKQIQFLSKRQHILVLLKVRHQYQQQLEYPYQIKIYESKNYDCVFFQNLENKMDLYRDIFQVFYQKFIDILVFQLNDFISVYKYQDKKYQFLHHIQIFKSVCQIICLRKQYIIAVQPQMTRFYVYYEKFSKFCNFFNTSSMDAFTLVSSMIPKSFFAYQTYYDQQQKVKFFCFYQHHLLYEGGENYKIGTNFTLKYSLTQRQAQSKVQVNEYLKNKVLVFFQDDISFIVMDLKKKTFIKFCSMRLNVPKGKEEEYFKLGRLFCINQENYEFGQKKKEKVMDLQVYKHENSVYWVKGFIQINKNFINLKMEKFIENKYEEILGLYTIN